MNGQKMNIPRKDYLCMQQPKPKPPVTMATWQYWFQVLCGLIIGIVLGAILTVGFGYY